MKLPPYHPDTPELQYDREQYNNKMEDMDAWIGKMLASQSGAGMEKYDLRIARNLVAKWRI